MEYGERVPFFYVKQIAFAYSSFYECHFNSKSLFGPL
jgi:hypothetical protein